MTSLRISVRPDNGLSNEDKKKLPVLFSRLLYTSEVSLYGEDPDQVAEHINLPSSLYEPLSNSGEAVLEVEDYKDNTNFSVRIETAQGAILWASAELDNSVNIVTVPKNILTEASDRTYPDITPLLKRSGRFVHMGKSKQNFENYYFYVVGVEEGTPEENSAKSFLGINQNNPLTNQVNVVEPKDIKYAELNSLSMKPAILRPDGSFAFTVKVQGDAEGWLWVLIGEQVYSGYVVDPE